MRISRLTIERLRNLQSVDLVPGPGLNLITGANGAGKSSVLEAVHLLAYGRSFRGRVRDGVIQTGADALEVFAEFNELAEVVGPRRVGLRHAGGSWEGRIDGESVDQLGVLCSALAALTFEPGSHALVNGGGEARRRYLDWGLFHVERDSSDGFFKHWRRYGRALKQRNALLKQGGGNAQVDAWDRELAEVGEPLSLIRQSYLARLQVQLQSRSQELLPQLGDAQLHYQPGWRQDQVSLADALLLARDRDRATGFTSVGPHRADWRIEHSGRPAQEALSRGQAKLTALACLLAQAGDFAEHRGQWPVVLLDDLASELDQSHQQRLLEQLLRSGAQVFVTGTEPLPLLSRITQPAAQFHVEHGQISVRQQP